MPSGPKTTPKDLAPMVLFEQSRSTVEQLPFVQHLKNADRMHWELALCTAQVPASIRRMETRGEPRRMLCWMEKKCLRAGESRVQA